MRFDTSTADKLFEHTYKNNKKEIDDVVAAVREEAGKFTNPKGISKYGMKLSSVPGSIYNAFCHRYGRLIWQDPHFIQWFLKKCPYFKYVPSVQWTTSRF